MLFFKFCQFILVEKNAEKKYSFFFNEIIFFVYLKRDYPIPPTPNGYKILPRKDTIWYPKKITPVSSTPSG